MVLLLHFPAPLMLAIALRTLPILHFISHCFGYIFVPDNAKAVIDPRIPVLYNITTAQTLLPTDENPLTGYYISSFLTTTTGSQYYMVAGILGTSEVTGYGFSILDLRTLERVAYGNTTVYSASETASFNFTRDTFAMFGADPANIAIAMRINATASREDGSQVPMALDLLVHASSPALYYGGTGAWMFVDAPVYNFAFPAATTSGWLRGLSSDLSMTDYADAALQAIDPSASFSWYDRIWGRLGLRDGNSTWFNLYLDDSELILVTYLIDESSTSASSTRTPTHTRTRNIHIRPRRNSSALTLEPVDVFEPDLSPDTVWTSPRSGLVYPQHWELGIEGRGLLSIRSVLGDQEMFDPGRGGQSYFGFVTCEGVFDGVPVTGYGGVEVRFGSSVTGDVPGDLRG
ncbi:Hydroxyneurosporene synthase-domain-containing protein [Aspergillus spinulosporus]